MQKMAIKEVLCKQSTQRHVTPKPRNYVAQIMNVYILSTAKHCNRSTNNINQTYDSSHIGKQLELALSLQVPRRENVQTGCVVPLAKTRRKTCYIC